MIHGPLAPKLPQALAFLTGAERVQPMHRAAVASRVEIVHSATNGAVTRVRMRWHHRAHRGSRVVPSFEEGTAVTEESLPEAWEAAATRGLIPESWVQDAARSFRTRDPEGTPYPRTVGAMLAFLAMGPELVLRAESLLRAAVPGLQRLGICDVPVDHMVWRAWDPRSGINPENPATGEYLLQRARPLLANQSREVYKLLNQLGLTTDPWRHEWPTCVGRVLQEHVDCAPSDENPFIPLYDLHRMGLGFIYGDGFAPELWLPVPEGEDERAQERDDRRHNQDEAVAEEIRREGLFA